jgi:hypothetical protein
MLEPGQPGASNLPADTATAVSHRVISTTNGPTRAASPNRARAAAAAAAITASVSAQADPAGPGSTGSGASARHHPVNTARTASSRPAKRRNHPRTVSTGRSSNTATRRCPAPAACAANAAQITAAVSARLTSTNTGNNTCVTPQPVQRDRRGRNRTGPCGPRT